MSSLRSGALVRPEAPAQIASGASEGGSTPHSEAQLDPITATIPDRGNTRSPNEQRNERSTDTPKMETLTPYPTPVYFVADASTPCTPSLNNDLGAIFDFKSLLQAHENDKKIIEELQKERENDKKIIEELQKERENDKKIIEELKKKLTNEIKEQKDRLKNIHDREEKIKEDLYHRIAKLEHLKSENQMQLAWMVPSLKHIYLRQIGQVIRAGLFSIATRKKCYLKEDGHLDKQQIEKIELSILGGKRYLSIKSKIKELSKLAVNHAHPGSADLHAHALFLFLDDRSALQMWDLYQRTVRLAGELLVQETRKQ